MFKPYNQNQIQLLPSSFEEIIKEDHLVRLINQVIDDLDTSFIENTYSANGQHAYHPKMLLKVIVYGYTIGCRSSRKLADKLSEDIVFMWLSGRQTPDFRTIADFRKEKLRDIKKTFVQIISLCQQLGMVRVGKVSIDGTKLRADASGNKIQYRKLLEKRMGIIDQKVQEILDEAEQLDQKEEEIYGDQTEHGTGIDLRELKKLQKRKQTIKREKEKLEAKQSDIDNKLEKMRQDRNSMSTTDKDATLMLMKEGYIAPGYNLQLASEHQVILAYGLYSNRNDQNLLKPMIEKIIENTNRQPEITITDAGYGTKENYRYLDEQKITSFIPYINLNKEMAERRKGVYSPPQNIDPQWEQYKLTQKIRLFSPEGAAMMKRRRQDVEPTIGDIKRNMNFRSFHLRGKPKCLIEVGLISIGHNLKKIKRYIEKQVKLDTGEQALTKLGTVLGYSPLNQQIL